MEYAVYKGDTLLAIGTKEECAEQLSVKSETILFYTSASYQNRVKQPKNRRIAIRLEDQR